MVPNNQPRPQLMASSDGNAVGFADGMAPTDNGSATSGYQPVTGNGIVAGGLPHFCQVWSGGAGTDAYGADKLLAQMDAEGQASLFASQSVTDPEAVLSLTEDVGQQVASMYR